MADIVVQFRGTVYENGYGQIAQKVMRDKSIHAVAKAIYAYLVSFAGQDGSAFPSVELMMEELGIKSEDTFYKYRKQLLNAGYISIEQQQRVKGQFYNNVYIIELLPYPKKSSTEPHPNSSSTVNSSTKKSGTTINNSSQTSDLENNQLKITTNTPAVVANSTEINQVINEIEARLEHPIRSLYKHFPRWLDEHGANELIAQAEYIASLAQTKGLRNIVGAFRVAVEEEWDTITTSIDTTSQTSTTSQKDERYAAFYELFPDD